MEWSTHMLSGAVAGYYVTGGDFRGALIGGIAGVIPDLDEPKSKFGRLFFPISIPLNQMFGHRTFTHSLVFILISGAFFYIFTEAWVSYSVIAGIFAHVIGDMLTGKVNFLYPLKKSVGIPIPPYLFTFMDRLARCLLVIIVFFIFVENLPVT